MNPTRYAMSKDRYKLLFRITCYHEYYGDGPLPDIRFFPLGGLASLLSGPMLLARNEPAGISIFYNDALRDDLAVPVSDHFSRQAVWIGFQAQNPHFFNFTDLSFPSQDQILFLSAASAIPYGRCAHCRNRDTFVSDAHIKSVEDPALAGLFPKGCRPMTLPGLVCMDLPDPTDLFDAPLHYTLRFTSRKTLWKYYLPYNGAFEALTIVDLDNGLTFSQQPDEVLPTGDRAMVFQSGRTIAMAHRPQNRLQLRQDREKNARVLINRLPVASARQINRQAAASNTPVYVSEIFINR